MEGLGISNKKQVRERNATELCKDQKGEHGMAEEEKQAQEKLYIQNEQEQKIIHRASNNHLYI